MNELLELDATFSAVEPDDHYGAAQYHDRQVLDDDRGGHDDHIDANAVQIPATADYGIPVERLTAEKSMVNAAAPVALGCLVLVEAGNPVERELVGLAAKINQEHDAFNTGVRTTFQHALAAGEGLRRAKEIVGHGRWIDWVEENCKFALRTGQKYMRLAQRCRESQGNAPLSAHLTIEAVLEVFAIPHAALANGASAVADFLNAGGDSEHIQPDHHDEDRVDADEAVGSRESRGPSLPGSEAPRAIPAASHKKVRKDQGTRHEDRCRLLRRITSARTTPESRIINTNVKVGIDAVLKDVRQVLLDHGKSQCTAATRKHGADSTFMAMALAKELKNRLDPCELFKPKHVVGTSRHD